MQLLLVGIGIVQLYLLHEERPVAACLLLVCMVLSCFHTNPNLLLALSLCISFCVTYSTEGFRSKNSVAAKMRRAQKRRDAVARRVKKRREAVARRVKKRRDAAARREKKRHDRRMQDKRKRRERARKKKEEEKRRVQAESELNKLYQALLFSTPAAVDEKPKNPNINTLASSATQKLIDFNYEKQNQQINMLNKEFSQAYQNTKQDLQNNLANPTMTGKCRDGVLCSKYASLYASEAYTSNFQALYDRIMSQMGSLEQIPPVTIQKI